MPAEILCASACARAVDPWSRRPGVQGQEETSQLNREPDPPSHHLVLSRPPRTARRPPLPGGPPALPSIRVQMLILRPSQAPQGNFASFRASLSPGGGCLMLVVAGLRSRLTLEGVRPVPPASEAGDWRWPSGPRSPAGGSPQGRSELGCRGPKCIVTAPPFPLTLGCFRQNHHTRF